MSTPAPKAMMPATSRWGSRVKKPAAAPSNSALPASPPHSPAWSHNRAFAPPGPEGPHPPGDDGTPRCQTADGPGGAFDA